MELIQTQELKIDLEAIRSKLSKPLLPVWVTQDDADLPDLEQALEYHYVILCTSSYHVEGTEDTDVDYVQGAGDDSEAWAHGLTPALFWKHKESLMSASEDDLPNVIEKLATQNPTTTSHSQLRPISPTQQIFISSVANALALSFETNIQAIITCEPFFREDFAERLGPRYLHLKCASGKQGSRDLRLELPKLRTFLPRLGTQNVSSILISCETGKDISAGATLAILCLCAQDDGK